jgi:hypothetical protein
MELALDEPRDDDVQEQVRGIPFVMTTQDAKRVGSQRAVRVDHLGMSLRGGGFHVATLLVADCLEWFAPETP